MWPATIVKFRTFATQKTTNTRNAKPPSGCKGGVVDRLRARSRRAAGRTCTSPRWRAARCRGCGRGARRRCAQPSPIATAGAGPSSAIARTRPRNEPEIRARLVSSVRKSLPQASTASRPTSSGGFHCSAVGEQHRRGDARDEQHASNATTSDAACGSGAGAVDRAATARSGRGLALALGGARRAHQRERPGDDHQPQDHRQPDDHKEEGSACSSPSATGNARGYYESGRFRAQIAWFRSRPHHNAWRRRRPP